MKLSRLVPARWKTVKFRWCRKFLVMSEKYRKARESHI